VWAKRKASANLKKHGISFDEAQTVFYDEHARHMPDPDHSLDEERFILLGMAVYTSGDECPYADTGSVSLLS